MAQSIKLHPRRCCITGEGMDSGYLINDGEMYIKYKSDMIKHIREVEKKGNPDYDVLVSEGSLTDDFLLNDYYEHEYYYYTDWECPDDIQFVEVDGVMYEDGTEEFDWAIAKEKVTQTKTDKMVLNGLIAEFMGWELQDNPKERWYGSYRETNGSRDLHRNTMTDPLLFHCSWDWLMPVVEKIESLRDTNGNAYRFTIDMCNAQIEETNIEILGGAFKLDTTYKAVVEFITNLKTI